MVSDADLVERLREFLRSSDLSTTTTAIVRRRLEADFAVDLTDKKAFIREQVDLFLNELENKEEEVEEAEEEGGSGEEVEEEEEEDEEEEEGEGDGGKKSNGKSRKKRESQKPKEAKKRGGGGFTKLCSLSPQLEEFLGVSELARTQVVKKIWEYIRENSLQNPSNKRKIMCDDKLQSLFKVDTIDMFQMTKALSKHIWPLNSGDGAAGPSKSTPKEKQPKREREDSEESSQKAKKPKGGNSGGSSALMVPLQLSDALAKFIGTGETALSRSDVVKRMWEYIKLNNLQDPADKRNIICDEKLKELFEVDSFTGFTVSKLLASHFIKS